MPVADESEPENTDLPAKAGSSIAVHGTVSRLTIIERVFGDVYTQSEHVGGPSLVAPLEGSVKDRLSAYGYDVVFCGRDTELAELQAFALAIEDQPSFKWWLWTGPGGQGKTRLADMFCSVLMEKGWRCGFLPRDDDYDGWNKWIVDRPTLIVIDHLATRAESISKIIGKLSRAKDRILAPLRVLVLERPFEFDDAWVGQFLPSAFPHEASEILTSAYHPSGLPRRRLEDCTRKLEPLPDAVLKQIVSHAAMDGSKLSNETVDAAVDWLKQADVDQRPLFLILAIRAVVASPVQSLRQWDSADLFDSILQRDFLLSQELLGLTKLPLLSPPRILFEQHLNLLSVATIGGYANDDILARYAEFGVDLPPLIQDDWLRTIAGSATRDADGGFVGLKPDLLGEGFILERCAGNLRVDRPRHDSVSQGVTLLSAALAADARETIEFARRCIADFPNHDGLKSFTLLNIPEGDKANIGHVMDYAVHFSQIAVLFDNAGLKELGESCLGQLIVVCDRLRGATDEQLPGFVAQYIATAYYNRALSRLRRQKNSAAIEDLTQCLSYVETSREGRRGARARDEVDRLWITSMRLKAVAELQLKTIDDAFASIQAILDSGFAITEEKAEAYLVRADILLEGDDIDGAVGDLEAILALGEEAKEQADYARARLSQVLYYRSTERGKNDIYLELDDLDRALKLVQSSDNLAAKMHINRAGALVKLGEFERALADYNEVIDQDEWSDDQHFKAYIMRAQIFSLHDQPKDALEDLDQASNLSSLSPRQKLELLFLRANVYRRSGQHEEAIAACEFALTVTDEDFAPMFSDMLTEMRKPL
ncbi:hypothetical protein DEM27_24305 [Metarhizobium album]|uniref:Uncharacterized protein n=1 Tax=Metarhizobium album TaxID=2182425 RepID=A0A2U2DK76_9HYPH|nr:tetratricopeptide repeat protein [Rhizobium album]PWE53670.1 hypothetical protein DEM27_24305 [Rhizobium album]